MERIKFIIVEKSYLIRKGIASIINRIEKASVVCELDNLMNLKSEILKHNPHFLVINHSFSELPEVLIHAEITFNMQEKGIAIFSAKPESNNTSLYRECIYIEDEKQLIFSKIENLIRNTSGNNSKNTNELSEREKSILKLVATGLTNKEIADKLFLSAHTVMTHRKNITAKLGIKSISGLTVYAILNNILTMNEIENGKNF
jgi:two-component system, NarL family, response regulator NreC